MLVVALLFEAYQRSGTCRLAVQCFDFKLIESYWEVAIATKGIPRPGDPVRGSTTGRPVMAALDLLGRRWALRVLWELHLQPAGFRELQRRCDNMSSSVLTTRLEELVGAGLVAEGERGYELTRLGEGLEKAIAPLEAWSKRWAKSLG